LTPKSGTKSPGSAMRSDMASNRSLRNRRMSFMSVKSPTSFTRSQSIVIDFSKWDNMMGNLNRDIEGR